jgi:hypothetical protein
LTAAERRSARQLNDPTRRESTEKSDFVRYRLPSSVIAGLDPAIQPAREISWIYQESLDRRVKPGDDS